VKTRLALTSVLAALPIVLGLDAASGSAAATCPISNPPDELVLAGGSGQTAQLGKPFPAGLEVQLANSNGCPLTGNLAGVDIDFDAPGSGASGIFAGSGSREAIVGTNAQGIATAPTFTANYTAGSYTVDAHSDYGTVELYLTNTASGLPAAISAVGTSSQEAAVNSQYPQPLQARVTDANGNPVQGATVSFSVAPGPTGAGAAFLGAGQATATTNADGVATSPPLLANASAGRFTAAASTDGVSTIATYALDNHAATLTIQAAADADPTAAVGSRYRRRLQATVLDANSQPIEGATVTFVLTQGDSGAGATFLDGSTQAVESTDSNGRTTSPALVANKTAGAFAATATTAGDAGPATYTLTNLAGPPYTLAAGAADGTSTGIGARLPIRLAVTVTDRDGNPVPGALVRFTAPRHGPGGHFTIRNHTKKAAKHAHTKPARTRTARTHQSRSARVRTNAKGIAIAPPFTANHTSGGYAVTVRAGSRRTAFALVNRP
jgi:protocatechuate 3,4-dioxygenase beta subunit